MYIAIVLYTAGQRDFDILPLFRLWFIMVYETAELLYPYCGGRSVKRSDYLNDPCEVFLRFIHAAASQKPSAVHILLFHP